MFKARLQARAITVSSSQTPTAPARRPGGFRSECRRL